MYYNIPLILLPTYLYFRALQVMALSLGMAPF